MCMRGIFLRGWKNVFFVFFSQQNEEAFLGAEQGLSWGWEVLEKRNAKSVCLGIVCASERNVSLHVTEGRVAERWKKHKGNFAALYEPDCFVGNHPFTFTFILQSGNISGLMELFWWNLMDRKKLHRSHQERWCLMWHQQTTSFMKLNGESRVLLL